ncbi:hypothetical protein OH77DRAFT_480585 [Trametes cingulata]|nr:hypothetical protein OH77DRAFT_480585 [Trametes cingulata]
MHLRRGAVPAVPCQLGRSWDDLVQGLDWVRFSSQVYFHVHGIPHFDDAEISGIVPVGLFLLLITPRNFALGTAVMPNTSERSVLKTLHISPGTLCEFSTYQTSPPH